MKRKTLKIMTMCFIAGFTAYNANLAINLQNGGSLLNYFSLKVLSQENNQTESSNPDWTRGLQMTDKKKLVKAIYYVTPNTGILLDYSIYKTIKCCVGASQNTLCNKANQSPDC